MVLLVRTYEMVSRSGRVFIEIGLFSDRLCHLGSYEMFVCPDNLPPYETFLTILAIMLLVSVWMIGRKHLQSA